MSEAIIDLKGICKAFSGNRALIDIDLRIDPGEILCLCGENGCGKSTLIKIISGVYSFDAGTVSINGKAYHRLTATQSSKEGIQVIYQDFSVFSNLTVAENIAISQSVNNKKRFIRKKDNETIARNALARIGIKLDLNETVDKLSVAEKQIVAISRAICQDAKLIIMDEPTTAITRKEIEKLFEIITGLKKNGVAVMFVSHKLDEVMQISDRIAVIRNGEKVIDQNIREFPRDKLAYYMTGKEIAEEAFRYEDSDVPPLLRVEHASRPGEFDDVSFEVRPGEILAVTGQLGSGRTELAKALFGLNPVTRGKIYIDGKETAIRNCRDPIKNKIAYLPEDRLSEGLLLNRPIGDNFVTAIIDTLRGRSGMIQEKRIEEISDFWIRKLNMSAKRYTTPAGAYSGGNQQRIVLGKWLASKPRIFILNCPTVGVDVKSKSEIHGIIKDLAREGLAIVLISDDVGEIMTTSNKVLIMRNGKVVFASDTDRVDADEISGKIISSFDS